MCSNFSKTELTLGMTLDNITKALFKISELKFLDFKRDGKNKGILGRIRTSMKCRSITLLKITRIPKVVNAATFLYFDTSGLDRFGGLKYFNTSLILLSVFGFN
jgi:hypothetical protein